MRTLTAILVSLSLTGCLAQQSALERVKSRGELIVLTRNSATTYYQGPDGPTGLEYDLAKMFADSLGVKLKIVTRQNFPEIIPMIANGEADLAAAGLTVTDERRRSVRFGPPYQVITQQLVYRTGSAKPRDLNQLNATNFEVIAASSHAERLRELQAEYPALKWRENASVESEDLLRLVWENLIEYTVADSNELAVNQRVYPELRVAMELSGPQELAWAFPPGVDDSLYEAATRFFARIKENRRLAQLVERHYGHVQKFDYVDTLTYMSHIQSRLPELRPLFEEAAQRYHLDWRLLAAIAYQESHWDEHAVSPTGVRGIMMLTRHTARHLEIEDRRDLEQSIEGGARYFSMLKKKIPAHIAEPVRTWMALAAYNVGYGHLEDARRLAQKNGADPDKWIDVKKTLPLLSQRKWFVQTRHGYARGMEPVRYVENVRGYYSVLAWVTRKENPVIEEPAALAIDSPVL